MRLISFRGDKEVWDSFKKKAKKEDKTIWDTLAPLLHNYVPRRFSIEEIESLKTDLEDWVRNIVSEEIEIIKRG